jgi:hypothetical protein
MIKSRSSADDYFILSCDRGGQYRRFKNVPEGQRIRKSGTKKIGCKVSIKGFYIERVFGDLPVSTFTTIILLTRNLGPSRGKAFESL